VPSPTSARLAMLRTCDGAGATIVSPKEDCHATYRHLSCDSRARHHHVDW
jgi:hypothetical protein